MAKLFLGLDSSTQSLSAVIIDLDAHKVFEIPSGRTFPITDQNAGTSWVKIEFEGQSGYVRKGKDYVVTG